MTRDVLGLLLVVSLQIGCTESARVGDDRTSSENLAGAAEDSAQRDSVVGFYDSDEDIDPTPTQKTELGVRILKQWIRHYASAHQGRAPTQLSDIVPPDPTDPNLLPVNIYWQDGWNEQFRYEPMGRGYIIRSSGPDRKWDTTDDLVWRQTLES